MMHPEITRQLVLARQQELLRQARPSPRLWRDTDPARRRHAHSGFSALHAITRLLDRQQTVEEASRASSASTNC